MNPRSTSAPCEPFVLPRLLGATPPRSRLCLWPYSLRSATPRPRDDAAAGIRCARPARRWHSGGLQTFALTQPSRRERLSAARLGCATTTCCATTAGPPVSRVTSAATPQTSSAKLAQFGDETGRGADEHGREPDRRSRSGPAIEAIELQTCGRQGLVRGEAAQESASRVRERPTGRAFVERQGRAKHRHDDSVAVRATQRTFPTPSGSGEPSSEQPVRASAQLSDRGRLRDAFARR